MNVKVGQIWKWKHNTTQGVVILIEHISFFNGLCSVLSTKPGLSIESGQPYKGTILTNDVESHYTLVTDSTEFKTLKLLLVL